MQTILVAFINILTFKLKEEKCYQQEHELSTVHHFRPIV